MFKQYPTIRVLRCATLALLLAAGLEGLRHIAVPGLSAWQSHIAAILLSASVAFLLTFGLFCRETSRSNSLKEEANLSEDLVKRFPEIACIIGQDGRFQQWNSTLEKALDYTAQEVTQMTSYDSVVAEEQRETVRHTLATTLTVGTAKAESVLMSKDGTRIPCLFTGVRVVVNDQPCVLGIAADLRKLRHAEESLRLSEEDYRSLVDTIPEIVWKADWEGHVSLVGRKVETMLGYSTAEIYQQGDSLWYNSVHIDDRERVRQAFESLIKEGTPYDIECRVRRKNGEWFWAHDRAAVTCDRNGTRVATGLLSDITERKAAEEALHKLASIVEFSQDAIVGKNMDGEITSWNRAAEQMYGYTTAEAVGRHLSFLLPADKQAETRVLMERIGRGQPIECLETQRLTKGGSILDVSLSISPIKDGSGQVTGASAIARDITVRKRADEQLRLLSAALEAAANAIVITNYEGTIVWVNPAFTSMTGYSKEEALGQNSRLLKSGEQAESYYASLWSTISSGKVWNGEIVNKRKDGTTYTEAMTITPVTRDVSNPANRYFIAIKQDVTERKQIEQALRQAEENYRAIFEDAVIGIFQSTPGERYINVNPAMAHMLGYESPHELVASITDISQQVYADPNDREELKRLLKEQGMVKNFECAVYRKDGSKMWFSANVRAVFKDGVLVGYEGTNEDITARKVAEERVQFLAYYDALTGLPNRTLFRDRLAKALAGARRQEYRVAILFLDLDRFKDINDSLGHSVGDLLLQEVAERLKTWGREQDTVARLGGDEFLIMLTDVENVPDAAVTAQRLIDAMTTEFVVQGHSLKVSCSIGISIFPEHGEDGETLINRADAAMYSAKDYGRNHFRFFTEDMNAQAVERLTLENSLRLALEKKELFLMYQPQMQIATGRITGLEALLRWQHPDLGLVPPDKFIRIGENSGLILPIGEWVLRTACSQARKWQDEGLPPVRVAVNVSAIQFRQKNFCELVRRVLHETGLAPQYLELELTESLLLSNADLMLSVVQELTAMGLTLAIDDFGTGYSSFAYLRQFRISKLKIDRVFIRDVAVNPDDAAITTAIISMAKSLRLKVIAEGVENEAQMSFLRAHHCDEIQGYYFSKPLAVDKVADKLRGDSPEPQAERKPGGDNPDNKPYEVGISLMSIGLALLVSADPVTIQQFSLALRELYISPDACQDAASAGLLLKHRKFDAVIVDLQLGEQSGLILDEVHLSSSNRTAVTFGISDNDAEVTAGFRKKSQFVFERPLSAQSIHKTLKPAYGLILRERRRYFRYPVSIPVIIRTESNEEVPCNTVNISGGGMALSTHVPLLPGENVHVQFTVPDHTAPIFAQSAICWSKTGHLGVRFVSISEEHTSELQVWLSQKLEETLPEFVAGQFRKAELCSH
jgi:diguanylate cyclase (GGDEF)-like protein/PAS domain S-box-containing protein